MLENPALILASKSTFRAKMLEDAGLTFTIQPADIDERAVEEPLIKSGLEGPDIPLILAQAKASSVSAQHPDAIVIGSDQTLVFDHQQLHKPKNMEEARRRLLLLSGKTHALHSAVALVQNEEIIWSFTQQANIRFRELDPAFIGRHLAKVGEKALTSVGAYHIEGEGVHLIDSIDGDFFSIMGMPLIPLIQQLRKMGQIDG